MPILEINAYSLEINAYSIIAGAYSSDVKLDIDTCTGCSFLVKREISNYINIYVLLLTGNHADIHNVYLTCNKVYKGRN